MSKINDTNPNQSRRRFVVTSGGAIGLAALAGVLSRSAQAGDLPHLPESDPAAKGFAYTEDAKTSKNPKYVAGNECLNCDFYQARATPSAAYGPCIIYPNKAVNAHGWCSNYVKVR